MARSPQPPADAPPFPSRIVVLSPNWLGDAVMALPALDDIRRGFHDARLAVAAPASLAPLFERVPGVDAVLRLGPSGRRRSSRADAARLREEGADVAVLFPNSFRAAWVTRRAGIPERWGYRADFRGPLLTRGVRRPRGPIHQGAYYQHLVGALDLPGGPLRPHVSVPDRDRMAGRSLLEREGWMGAPLVGLAPGAAYGFAKQWPPERFAEVVRGLAERGTWSVLVGLPADRAAGRRVIEAVEGARPAAAPPGSVLNLIGRTGIGELMGVMTHCEAFVANDSGAAHLAGALGVRVVAVFGPTDERVGAPLGGRTSTRANVTLSHDVFCRPCGLRECPIDHRCMTRIEGRQVLEALERDDGRHDGE